MRHDACILNIAGILVHRATTHASREAVVFQGTRMTYAELDAMASRVAHGLRSLGIGPGDHVALSCPNVPYFPIVYFGILKAGAVVVPLNVLLKTRELAYHLRDSDAKAYFCFEGTAELPMGAMGREAMAEAPDCQHFVMMPANPAAPAPEGMLSLQALVRDQPASFPTHPTRPDDTAVILYTSGTTGQPKGAELTHLNLAMNGAISRELGLSVYHHGSDARNVVLVTLPLFHSFGQVVQMVAHIGAGSTLVLLPRFDPAAVLDTMKAERVNFWSGVPTMFWALLQHVSATGYDVSAIAESLRMTFSGGAPMPVETMQAFERTFGVRVLEGYGLSETSPVATFNQLALPSKPGTVGQPVAGVEVACVDEHDSPVPIGERGEVVIRGHNIMKGYYKRPEATAEAMRNGWFHSGDIGVFDADGYLSIVDRKKDMIIRGGFNVYPRELEEVLVTHPAVSLCAVVGIPDERLGEEVKVFVVLQGGTSATESDILAWCAEQFAPYKRPRFVEFREALPMSATGKILKRELRQAEMARRQMTD
jgi:long-chain acyl-CoA synthetase